jgi:tetratricopeptide (TPR) repeat protein
VDTQFKSIGSGAEAINRAIVYVSIPNIRIIFRQELKRAGITEIVVPMTAEETCAALLKSRDALLVVDQQLEMRDLVEVLKVANGTEAVSTRPIFYMANVISPDVLGICSEYNVSRIHPGQLSRDVLFAHLNAIVNQESEASEIRDLLNQVRLAYEVKDYDKAESLLMPVFERYPNNMRIMCELAETYILSERWKEAENLLAKHALQYTSNIRLQHQLARCHMKARRYQDAEMILRNCDLINPFNVERLLDLGTALMHNDKVSDAYKQFNKALSLEPSNIDAKQGIGQCNLLLGEVNVGLDLLRQVTSDRELASIFNNSAIISVCHGRFEAGIELYKTAVSTLGKDNPTSAKLVFNLGLAYHKKGDEEEAKRCFELSSEMDPNFSNSKINLKILDSAEHDEDSIMSETNSGASIDEEDDEQLEESLMTG